MLIETAATAAHCANCVAPLAGEYCAACGQRRWEGRLTVRGAMGRLLADALDLNRGLLFTGLAMTVRPGAAIRAYVAGQVVRYTNPVKYFLLAGTLLVLAYAWSGAGAEMTAEFLAGASAGGPDAAVAAGLARALAILSAYMNLAMGAAIPLTALLSRLVFRRAGYNFAEHLVFNLFVYAHTTLFFALLLLAAGLAGVRATPVTNLFAVISTAYYAWAAVGFFEQRPLGGTLRALLVQAGSYALYLVFFIGAVGAYLAVTLG